MASARLVKDRGHAGVKFVQCKQSSAITKWLGEGHATIMQEDAILGRWLIAIINTLCIYNKHKKLWVWHMYMCIFTSIYIAARIPGDVFSVFLLKIFNLVYIK